MEEDIKNIEEIINLSKEEIENNNENVSAILDLEDLKSLHNLLTRYKQLEEENKNKTQKIIEYEKTLKKLQKETIWKSKVKEKIEEIDERIKYLHTEINKCVEEREKLGTETDIDNNETLIFHLEDEKEELYAKKQALQELLEEE